MVFSILAVAETRVAAKNEEIGTKCATPEFNEQFRMSTAIFVGKAVAIREENGMKIIEFSVGKYWKGISSNKVQIGVFETPRYEAWYQVGKTYLVYSRNDNGMLIDGRCSRSRELGDNFIAGDLKKLGKAKRTGLTGTRDR